MPHQTRFPALAACALACLSPLCAAEAQPRAPAYKTVMAVPLGGPDRWDYVVFDLSLIHI